MKRVVVAILGVSSACWSEVTVGVIVTGRADAGGRGDLGGDATYDVGAPRDTNAVGDAPSGEVAPDAADAPAPPPCDAGLARCGDACVDLSTDGAHCGACGVRCNTRCIRRECGELLRDLALGLVHTCVTRVDGRVLCWGDNVDGQLGDGSRLGHETPSFVAGVLDAVDVVAGEDHTCVRRTAGLMSCWGANESGQLGDGTRDSRPLPVDVVGASALEAVAVGLSFSCAVGDGGRVKCWGFNGTGTLGLGDMTDRLTPDRAIEGLDGVTRLSCGHRHTCAVRAARAWCWGEDGEGALGRGHIVAPTGFPDIVPGIEQIQELGTGEDHTCARLTDGTVWCWGANTSGQLGDGTRVDRASPVPVQRLTNIQQLAVAPGQNFSCALDRDGIPWCWGNNDFGQLGRGTIGPTGVPGDPQAVLVNSWRVARLRAGGVRACGILVDHRGLICWGWNDSGTFGALTPRMSAVPVLVPLPDLP